MHSPLQEMDGVVCCLNLEVDEPVPQTPQGARESQPITVDVLRQLFDEKLQPVMTAVDGMRNEVGGLKMQVAEHAEHIDMNDTKIANMQVQMEDWEGKTNSKFAEVDSRIGSMQQSISTKGPINEMNIDAKIKEIERDIQQMRAIGDTDDKAHMKKIVVGGLKNLANVEEAIKVLTDKLWEKWGPMPVDHYCKGDYSGIVFLKFESQTERDRALAVLNKVEKTGEFNDLWAEADQPSEVRAVQQVSFGAKWLLHKWDYVKSSMWVDEEAGVLWMGQDEVLRAFVSGAGLVVEYGSGWEEYLQSDG